VKAGTAGRGVAAGGLDGDVRAACAGVTALDGDDAALVPALLVAVTVKVYAWPLVSPVTTIGLPLLLAVRLPGDEVTVYDVIAAPPFDTGGVKVITAKPLPAVALIPVGAPGATATKVGVAALDGLEGWLAPIALVAVTVKV
jgi:hypothetical protein